METLIDFKKLEAALEKVDEFKEEFKETNAENHGLTVTWS